MKEADLYEPIRSFLASPQFEPTAPAPLTKRVRWAFNSSQVGWLGDAGDWMRPDITLFNISRHKYATFADLSVHAVEVKRDQSSLVSGLFQALSYSRIADYCWLAAPNSEKWPSRTEDIARRFGIGLIRIGADLTWSSMSTVPGQRMQPDMELRDEFIDALIAQQSEYENKPQLRDDIHAKIGRWT